MIAKTLLELNTVTIGNSNIVHVHTEHKATYIVSISYSSSNTSPYSNLLLSLCALPVTYNDLTCHTHASTDMSELDITMCRLVEVHEVHVDRIPRKVSIILSVEMKQRLLKSLKALDPHLCRREGVHPSDNADTLSIIARSLHHSLNLIRRVCCTLVNYLNRNNTTIVKALNHFL